MSTVQGVVKSWNGAKGFGFITCPQVAGDVFFGKTDLPEDAQEVTGKFLDGRMVFFSLMPGGDGKYKAMNMKIPFEPGKPCAGVIKTFSESTGYGFITSSSLDQDVRFERKDLPVAPGQNLRGELVNFEVQALPDGKIRVGQVRFQSKAAAERLGLVPVAPADAASSAAASAAAANAAAAAASFMTQAAPQMPTAESLASMAQYASMAQLYGLASMGGLGGLMGMQMGGLGAMAGLAGIPGLAGLPGMAGLAGLQGLAGLPGMGSIPGIASMSSMAADPLAAYAADAAAQSGQLTGTVKSFSERNGYGFIKMPGTTADIFFGKNEINCDLTLLMPGALVCFTPSVAPDGRMNGKQVNVIGGVGMKRPAVVVAPGFQAALSNSAFEDYAGFGPAVKRARQEEALAGVTQGVIKTYNSMKGFGFISCPGVQQDVYFMKVQLPHEMQEVNLQGRAVNFEVTYAADGKIRASSICLA